MKKKIAALALVLAAFAAAPASAEETSFDVKSITCADASQGDKESLGVILAWIDGYVGGEAGDTTLDLGRFGENVDKAVEICGKDPSKALLDVMKEAEGVE